MNIPHNIDFTQPEKYTLSVRIYQTGFSYTIYEKGKGNSFFYREFAFAKDLDIQTNIEQIIYDNDFLIRAYKLVNIVYITPTYDLVPETLYEKKYQNKLFDFVHFEHNGEILTNNKLIQDNYLMYSTDKEVHRFLARSFNNPQFYHHAGCLLPYFANKIKTLKSNGHMVVHFHDKMMDIFCFKDVKIHHTLTYKHLNTQDIIYYTLSLWKKCDFNQETDHLLISGLTDDLNKIIEILNKYIRNISIVGKPSEVQFLTTDASKTPLDLLLFSL